MNTATIWKDHWLINIITLRIKLRGKDEFLNREGNKNRFLLFFAKKIA